jgi:HAD superfamily hydrolase (TIGR01490 family)
MVRLCEEIYEDAIANRIWDGARELTRRYLAIGAPVWLVTATPVELATVIAERLGLTGALGTVAETDDGVYTGRLTGGLVHGQGKAVAIRALAEREGLDLDRCAAFSDSSNDLPMLELVGYPNVVNPDARLRVEAQRRGWPVYEFGYARKVRDIALPVAAGAGAVAGGMAAGVALHRRRTSF